MSHLTMDQCSTDSTIYGSMQKGEYFIHGSAINKMSHVEMRKSSGDQSDHNL